MRKEAGFKFDFNCFTPTKAVFGKNTESRAAELIKEFGASTGADGEELSM
ncbi:MAG: hypothetical protein K6E34_08770 [Lachnospiraceae bacterium]|nr:hypothetical protein [Lachnospiraceae bacterium]